MKHDMNELRNALPGEPESCRIALLQAARSVQEDEPVKKLTFRTALVAALVIAAMMAVAVAATNGGLANWFQKDYGVALPQSAQEVLSASEKTALETELVTFTVNEMMCDGKIAYMTVEAHLKEAGTAILYPNSGDPTDRIGQQLAQELNHPNVNAESTYLDAAKTTGRPLYCVSASLEVSDNANVDSEMMDASMLENGHMLLVRMLYFREELDAATLPVTIVARVNELDLESLAFVKENEQRVEAEHSLPIHGVTAQRGYAPEGMAKLSECFTVTRVEAKQTCAGVYVTVHARLDTPMTVQQTLETGIFLEVLDEQGNPFPTGMSLTGEYLDESGQPLEWISEEKLEGIQFQMMISVDELPQSMTVTDGTAKIIVK